jgi:hypothetical protein
MCSTFACLLLRYCFFFRLFVLMPSSVLFSFLYRRTSHKLLCSQLHFREALTTNGYHYHKCVAFVFNLTHSIIKSLHFFEYNFLLIKFIKWNKIKFNSVHCRVMTSVMNQHQSTLLPRKFSSNYERLFGGKTTVG